MLSKQKWPNQTHDWPNVAQTLTATHVSFPGVFAEGPFLIKASARRTPLGKQPHLEIDFKEL
jgi:hypothetical protein